MFARSDVAPTLTEGDVRLRPLRLSDARRWQEVRRRNQGWLGPWDATVPEEGARAGEIPPTFAVMVRRLRAEARAGRVLPWVIEYRGRMVGQVTLGGITYGSLRSAYLGYWIDQEFAGRGITSLAVAMASDYALGVLHLHRLELNIRPENAASLAVANLVPRWSPIVLAVTVLAYVIATAATSSRRSASTATARKGRSSAEVPERIRAPYDDLVDDREIAYSDQVAEVAYPRTRGLRPPSRRSRDAQIAAAMDDFVSWDPWEAEESVAEEAWSAVPTTLPTYVNAPRATRVRRPIERDRDWSGEAMVEAARTMRRPRITVDDLADDTYALGNSSVAASDDTAELPAARMNAAYEQTRRAAGE